MVRGSDGTIVGEKMEQLEKKQQELKKLNEEMGDIPVESEVRQKSVNSRTIIYPELDTKGSDLEITYSEPSKVASKKTSAPSFGSIFNFGTSNKRVVPTGGRKTRKSRKSKKSRKTKKSRKSKKSRK
jgi:hypothetical protein